MLADFGVSMSVICCACSFHSSVQLSKVLEEDKFSVLTTTCGVSFSDRTRTSFSLAYD